MEEAHELFEANDFDNAMFKFENAKILYEKLYGLKCKKLATVLYNMGRIQRIKYDFEEASKYFNKSLHIYTDHYKINLGDALLEVNINASLRKYTNNDI